MRPASSSTTLRSNEAPTPAMLSGATISGPQSQRAPLLFVCTECWRTFIDGSLSACTCEAVRPANGWAAMPYLFRGRYLFVELLGRGGMGAVFRAYDQAAKDSPWVAVKVVQQGRPELADNLKEMFQKEVAAAQMLAQHKQFFVQVLGHDGVDPAYLVLEHVPWQTLGDVVSSLPGAAGSLPPGQVARIGVAVLRGVAKMHFHRIVHRDLTPSNIFIQPMADGEGYDVKITDLGIWAFDQVQSDSEALTLVGQRPTIDGSPPYMSPEQSIGEPVGATSDLHTLGSVLWELATGVVPYRVSGELPILEMIEARARALKDPLKRPAGMPEGLYRVLVKALAFEPKDRWQSAGEMRKALEAFIQSFQQQRQRDIEASLRQLDKLIHQVSSLREKLSPMRGLLEHLSLLGAMLRDARDQRDAADPEALRATAESATKQIEEIMSELQALAGFLGLVSGQKAKVSVTVQPPSDKNAVTVQALPVSEEHASRVFQLDKQPWFERSPWTPVVAIAGALLVFVLCYLALRSDPERASQGASPSATAAVKTAIIAPPPPPPPIEAVAPIASSAPTVTPVQAIPTDESAPPASSAKAGDPVSPTPTPTPTPTSTPKSTSAAESAHKPAKPPKLPSPKPPPPPPPPDGEDADGQRGLDRKNPYE